jgi:hypothetical protein
VAHTALSHALHHHTRAHAEADTANNLYKGIQIATMKVLRNTDQTAIFTTLLELLNDVLGGSGDFTAASQSKGLAEVLIKALGIAVQHIKETIDEMNLDQLLFDLNAFLEAHQDRPGDDVDVSIKAKMRQEAVRLCQLAVKEIVLIKGRAGVGRHLSLVPVTKYPTPGTNGIPLCCAVLCCAVLCCAVL